MLKRFIRNLFSERGDNYTFYRSNGSDFTFLERAGLYVHIPFCRNKCPYCPYYKVNYSKDKAGKFKESILKEIDKYGHKFKYKTVDSIYFGGGTPTLLIDEMPDILKKINEYFNIEGEIALETNPAEITKNIIVKLKKMNFGLISLGVQSFQQKFLDILGRKYSVRTTEKAVELLINGGFNTINIDLMFVLPNQNIKDIEYDIDKALSLGVDQITFYPLFTFPYTSIGKLKKLKNIGLPNYYRRKKMYYYIYTRMKKEGFKQTSVWSFNRYGNKTYSSVTRDYYLGFGPSAASYNGKGFYFNVFSVDEYIKMIDDRLPIVLKMNVSNRMAKLFWLYWRFYETYVPIGRYKDIFKSDLYTDFGKLLKFIEIAGFARRNNDILELTIRGAYYIHLVQNYFALNYVNKIWDKSWENTKPDNISL